MAGKTLDYHSLARHLHKCIKNSRACPSLKRLSLDVIAVTMWKIVDREIAKHYDDETSRLYRIHLTQTLEEIRVTLLNNAKTIIPKTLLRDFEYTVIQKITQVCFACDVHQACDEKLIREYFWTPSGRLDKLAIVRLLLQNEEMSDDKGFSLACSYCLEDEVIRLCETDKESFLFSRHNESIFEYWRSFVAGKNIFPADIENMVHHCIDFRNETSVEYFWSKLDVNERDNVFRKWSRDSREYDFFTCDQMDVCYFLLSRATEPQVLSLVESKTFQVFSSLVFSCKPEANLFMSTAIERMSAFISESQRAKVVDGLLECIINFNCAAVLVFYEEVLMIVWNGGSVEWKSTMRTNEDSRLLKLFTRMGRGDILIAMFDDATEEEKLEFVRSNIIEIHCKVWEKPSEVQEFLEGFFRLENSIGTFKRGLAMFGMQYNLEFLARWHRYEVFFGFCNLSEEEMVELKKQFCCYEKIKSWFSKSWVSSVAADKFLSWCLLSDTESNELRKLIRK